MRLNDQWLCIYGQLFFCSVAMEAIGIQVNTEKLLHFDELLKVYRSSQPAYRDLALLATKYFPLFFSLKLLRWNLVLIK